MVLDPREDSSWLAGSCCPAGEKGDDVDDEAGSSEGKWAVAGDWAWREGLGEGVLGLRCWCWCWWRWWSWAKAVEMGAMRVLWDCLGAPQGCCWLIEGGFP